MTVRAKFVVQRIERSKYYQGGEMQTIVLSPVTSGNSEEDKKFWAATPSGEIKLGVLNKSAGDYFELGKAYYVDFVLAE